MNSQNKSYIYFLASANNNKLIRFWQYGFKYTHIAICMEDLEIKKENKLNPFVIEMVLPEIRSGRFINLNGYGKIKEFSIFRVETTIDKKYKFYNEVIDKFRRKVKYDLLGILGFPFRNKNIEQKNKFFCSELAFYCLQKAGINILNYIKPSEVSPYLFLTSPLLEYCYTVKYNEDTNAYEEVTDESLQR